MKPLWLLIFLFHAGINLNCQEAFLDTIQFKTKDRITFFTNFGISLVNETRSLNNYLKKNHYPEVNRTFYDFNLMGLEGQYRRFIFKLNFMYSFNTKSENYNRNDYKTNLSTRGVSGTFGFEIFNNHHWAIFPLIGYETTFIWLELTNPVKDTFHINSIPANPNIFRIDKMNLLLKTEIGIRRKPHDKYNYTLYVGYKYDLFDDEWKYVNIKLTKYPRLRMTGFYINISVQFNHFF